MTRGALQIVDGVVVQLVGDAVVGHQGLGVGERAQSPVACPPRLRAGRVGAAPAPRSRRHRCASLLRSVRTGTNCGTRGLRTRKPAVRPPAPRRSGPGRCRGQPARIPSTPSSRPSPRSTACAAADWISRSRVLGHSAPGGQHQGVIADRRVVVGRGGDRVSLLDQRCRRGEFTREQVNASPVDEGLGQNCQRAGVTGMPDDGGGDSCENHRLVPQFVCRGLLRVSESREPVHRRTCSASVPRLCAHHVQRYRSARAARRVDAARKCVLPYRCNRKSTGRTGSRSRVPAACAARATSVTRRRFAEPAGVHGRGERLEVGLPGCVVVESLESCCGVE